MHQAAETSPAVEAHQRKGRPQAEPAVALALTVALVAWAALVAWREGGSALPYAELVAGAALAYAAGYLTGRRFAWLVAAGIAVGVAVAFAVSPGSLSGKALAAPLHYGNANGALAAQGAAACVVLAVLVRTWPVQVLAWLGGVGFLAVTVATRSQTATAATALLLLAGAIVAVARHASAPKYARPCRVVGRAAPVLVVVAALVTLAVGFAYTPGAKSQSAVVKVVEKPLSERRAALWHDAVTLTRDQPLTGIGPGQFAVESPVALSDRDTRWPHSAWLEQSAEQGLVGFALLGAVLAWVWRPLLRCANGPSRAAAVAAVGSWAVGALVLQAGVDYIWHFPAVPWTAALLIGAVTGWAKRVTESPRNVTTRL